LMSWWSVTSSTACDDSTACDESIESRIAIRFSRLAWACAWIPTKRARDP
jgi:hypothetical protein